MPNDYAQPEPTAFHRFCGHVAQRSPSQIVAAIGEELQNHQHGDAADDDLYARQLRSLQQLLEDGRMPADTPDGFYDDVAQLVRRLLLTWRIGNLGQVFAATYG